MDEEEEDEREGERRRDLNIRAITNANAVPPENAPSLCGGRVTNTGLSCAPDTDNAVTQYEAYTGTCFSQSRCKSLMPTASQRSLPQFESQSSADSKSLLPRYVAEFLLTVMAVGPPKRQKQLLRDEEPLSHGLLVVPGGCATYSTRLAYERTVAG